MDILARLETMIAARQSADPETSYVAMLNKRGMGVMARKLGEEAVEAVVAALSGDNEELVGESADILFHLMVVLQARGIAFDTVLEELARREGVSGIAEKAARLEG